MTDFSDRTALISRKACIMMIQQVPVCSLVYGAGEGQIGYWAFDETSGTIAEDSINDNDGTLEGGASFVNDATRGYVLDCDGVDGRCDVGNSSPIDDIGHRVNNPDVSFSFWMKGDATPNSNGIVITKYQNATDQWYLRSYATNTYLQFGFLLGVLNYNGTFSDLVCFDDTWHHIVLVVEDSVGASLWMDGVKSSSTVSWGVAGWENTGRLSFGAMDDGTVPYDGLIDDVRIYNKALTTTEISNLYLHPNSIACTASLAAGSECYNRWGTCQDKANYDQTTEELVLTSHDVAVGFPSRPYLKKITHAQTKISKSLTERARRTVTVLDDTADDINVDPYRSTRATTVTGMFWKNFLARVPNYRSFPAVIYNGYSDLAKAEFEEVGKGVIDKIVAGKNGTYTITLIDTFKTLSKVKFPEVIESELNAAVNDSQTAIVLTNIDKADGTELANGEYVQFDDEIVAITSAVTATNTINCSRGALGTTAAAHDDEAKVTMVKYYSPDLPIDQLRQLWQDAGNVLGDLDSSWTTWDSTAANDEKIAVIVTDSNKAAINDLWWEIVDLFDFSTWINEEGKVSIYRTFHNLPGRTYGEITDDANIKENSAGIKFNESSRISRVTLYWQKTPIGDPEDLDSYQRITAYINTAAETAYLDPAEKEFLGRWVTFFGQVEEDIVRSAKDIVRRKQRSWDEARQIVTVTCENKDLALKTGDEIYLETDRVGSLDGTTQRVKSLIVGRKELKHGIMFDVQVLPNRRICFVAPGATPVYGSATDAEKEYGFVSDNTTGLMPDGSAAYEVR